jgi:hypothetical protein
LFSYRDSGRTFPHPASAVQTILSLQDNQGGFGNDLCLNWDAAFVVKYLIEQMTACPFCRDVIQMGNRLAEYLLKYHRKEDGGFSFIREHCLVRHNSIIISEPKKESDTLGTYMSLQCLKYADNWRRTLN